MPEFKEREPAREQAKLEELAPYIEAAMARKKGLQELTDEEIPTFMSLGRKVSEETKNEKSIYERPAAG